MTDKQIALHIIEMLNTILPEYERKFDSFSTTAEYYGRGGIEGITWSLLPLFNNLNEEQREFVEKSVGLKAITTLQIWGERSAND